jgi:ubiquinone/menaquinone biosynthesis C-methylase UbiE
MTPEGAKSARVCAFYDQTARSLPGFRFMNYGYAPEPIRSAAELPEEGLCLELYRRVLCSTNLRGRDVLEVSCGRGGGGAFVVAEYEPASLIGIDLSEGNIEIAKAHYPGIHSLDFRVGAAEALAFPDGSFDAVLSIEASHLYEDPARFFHEAFRVLRPGGQLFYADLFWCDSDPIMLIVTAGFKVLADEDITQNVVRSLDLDSARRMQLIESSVPAELREAYRDWSGISGYRAYNRFASGEWIYRCFRLARPIKCSGPQC